MRIVRGENALDRWLKVVIGFGLLIGCPYSIWSVLTNWKSFTNPAGPGALPLGFDDHLVRSGVLTEIVAPVGLLILFFAALLMVRANWRPWCEL